MPRVGTSSSNLQDRDRYDLLILNFTDGYPKGNIKLAIGETPRKISGVQKVSQVFLKALMSRVTSDIMYPNLGTEFTNFSTFSNVSTTDNYKVRSEIESAIRAAESQAKSILNYPGTSLESQLESVTVSGVAVIGDSVSVQIKLLTKAGVEAPIALPFTSLGLTVNE